MNMEQVFKALSDPNRLKIYELLIKGETCGCTLIDKLPITQPTLSHHLKVLHLAGLTYAKKEGTWIKYHVNYEALDQVIGFLSGLKQMEGTCSI